MFGFARLDIFGAECKNSEVRFSQIRYNRFQTKEIVSMFGLERKKASVFLVLQDSVGKRKLIYKSLPCRGVTAENC